MGRDESGLPEDNRWPTGVEHEFIGRFQKAGMSYREAQAIIASPGNELAKRFTVLTSEYARDLIAQFDRLFDSQIATLNDRGVPVEIVVMLQRQKSRVLAKASAMAPPVGGWGGNIPFLPVIPRSFRSPYDLMAMVRNGETVGHTLLNATMIFDVVDAPQEPYYIYDVEDGNSTRGKSPQDAEKILQAQLRSGLTAAEVIALTTHTDVLSQHSVWATGSLFGSVNGVPYVCLRQSDRPELDWNYFLSSIDHRGSASCTSRGNEIVESNEQ